ncbi:hypothetical protein C8F01DRAFT_1193561, partial [Mycena amicta]
SQFLAVPVTFTFERPQDLDALVDREPPYSTTSSIRAVHHNGRARRPAYPPGLPVDDRDSDFMLTFGMDMSAHVHVPVMAAPPTGARERKNTHTNATAGNSNPPSYEDAIGVPLIQITPHDERATNSWSKMARLRGRVSGIFQRNHKNTVADTSGSSSTIPFSLAAAAVSTLDLTHSGTTTTPQRPGRSWSISQSLRARVNSGNVLGTDHNRPALPSMDPRQHAEPETRTMRNRRVRRSRSFSGFAGVQVHGELDLELLDQLDEVGREAYLALQGMMDSESGDCEGPL